MRIYKFDKTLKFIHCYELIHIINVKGICDAYAATMRGAKRNTQNGTESNIPIISIYSAFSI